MKKEVKTTLWQFIKFNIVGISNTAVDFAVYFLLTNLAGFNYILAQTCSYTAGIVNSYIWNTIWTFRKEKRRTAREIILFVVVNLVSYGVSVGVLALCKDVLHIPYELVSKIAASFFSAMVNFVGNKLFVFNKINPQFANESRTSGETPSNAAEQAPDGERGGKRE
jgi:putative flippase GtrA